MKMTFNYFQIRAYLTSHSYTGWFRRCNRDFFYRNGEAISIPADTNREFTLEEITTEFKNAKNLELSPAMELRRFLAWINKQVLTIKTQ